MTFKGNNAVRSVRSLYIVMFIKLEELYIVEDHSNILVDRSLQLTTVQQLGDFYTQENIAFDDNTSVVFNYNSAKFDAPIHSVCYSGVLFVGYTIVIFYNHGATFG